MTHVKVIAEIGLNWNHSMRLARDMIKKAKAAGADYVKTQYMCVKELGVAEPLHSRLKQLAPSLDELEEMQEVARRVGIEFLVTPMASINTLQRLVRRLEPKIIKIREADGRKDEFVNAAAQTGRTLLISVDPRKGPLLKPCENSYLLYNIPNYPPRTADFNHTLAGSADGFSSHYPHTTFDKISIREARSMGREVYWLEVHTTIDRNFDCLDRKVSIDFKDLAEVCSYAHRERRPQ